MRILVQLMTATSLLALSACASIVEGSTDKINVATSPSAQAACSFTNSRETQSAYVPSTVTVKRSKSDLNIICIDPNTGAEGRSTVVSDVEAWSFGNLLIGGLIGLGIDWGTGAAYTYPTTATVPMSTPVTYPAPEAVQSAPNAPMAMPNAPVATTEPVAEAPKPLLPPASDINAFGGPVGVQPVSK